MAPISEKRATQQPIQHQNSALLKENSTISTMQIVSHNAHGHVHRHNAHHHHAKENTNRGTGIEILDFHESWREEIEMYKDGAKHHSQLFNKHYLPQMLGTHNHVHTPQGCEFVNANKHTNGGAEKGVTNDKNNLNTKRKVVSTSLADNKHRLRGGAESIRREDVHISGEVNNQVSTFSYHYQIFPFYMAYNCL